MVLFCPFLWSQNYTGTKRIPFIRRALLGHRVFEDLGKEQQTGRFRAHSTELLLGSQASEMCCLAFKRVEKDKADSDQGSLSLIPNKVPNLPVIKGFC